MGVTAALALAASFGTTVTRHTSSRAYQYGPAGLASLGYYPVRYSSFTVR